MTLLGGVDAGGSHTEAVVWDLQREATARARGEASPLRADEVRRAADGIVATVREALSLAGLQEPLDVLVVGAAGGGIDTDRDRLRETLGGQGLARRVAVATDAEIALEGAFAGQPGIVLIAGTGSMALARDEARRLWRVGGYGWRLGDEGSGYAIGRAAVGAAIRAREGRGAATSLTESLARALALTTDEDWLRWARSARTGEIAGLAETVLATGADGDEVAAAIIDDAASHLAAHVRALLPRFPAEAGVPVAVHGGLLVRGSWLKARVADELARTAPRVRLLQTPADAAQGALHLAARIAERE